MKKLLLGLALLGSLVCGASAAENVRWPVWFAFNDEEDVDIIGLRLNFYSGSCDQMTGFDLGIIGRANTYNGLMINLGRNDVSDVLAGCQIGLYNSCGRGDALGGQLGFWNEASAIYGAQVGLVNVAEYAEGIQIGLINRTEDMHGYQIGLVNVIRGSTVPFCPIVNIGF